MKYRTILILVGIISITALFCAACKNIFPPVISPPIAEESGNPGNVTVSFSNLSGRTLWPSALDFDIYRFTFTNEDTNYEETFTGDNNPDGSFTFNVDEGAGYNLKVEAYKVIDSDEILAAEGETEELFTVSNSTAVSIRLKGNLLPGEDGAFSFIIQYPVGAVIDRLVLIEGLDNEIDALDGAVTDDDGVTETMSNTIDIPAGWYGLELDISHGHKITYYDDIVSIFSNTTTYYGKDTNPVIFRENDFLLPPSTTILILQANTYGNNNGLDQTPPAPTGGGFSRSVVELYNLTDSVIDFDIDDYYLHIGDESAWTTVIKLEGSIPAKSSFLVADNTAGGGVNATPRALLPAADQEAAFVLGNNGFKVALLKNQDAILSVTNPFADDSLFPDYVDMLGTVSNNGSANAYETEPAAQSRPQSPRRTSLVEINNNSVDFSQADFRGQTGSRGMDDSELYKFWPRNSASDAWNPITGEPCVDPEPYIPEPPMDGEIVFGTPAGLYKNPFDLTLTTTAVGATIRYTLNGEDPTADSAAYINPLSMTDRTGTYSEMEFANKPGTTGTNSQAGDYTSGPYPLGPDEFRSIFRGTVVKARLFNDSDQPVSEIFVNSYFVNADIFSRYGDLPVFSVSAPGDYFFDTDTGIYQMGDYPWVANGVYSEPDPDNPEAYIYNFDLDWERAAYIEMFEQSGDVSTRVLDQGMGVRIHGGGSRHNPQKSLRFYARTGTINAPEMGKSLPIINGKNIVDYDLFKGAAKDNNGNTISSFQRFVLRGHANEAAGALMRDPLGSVMAYDLACEVLAFRSAIVFLNGEFWGLYEIRERYDDRYLESHYGGNRNYYDILENPSHIIMGETQGTEESMNYYRNTVDYLESKVIEFGGMNNENAYTEFLKFIDEKSLIDYAVIETFSNHADWINRINWRKHRMGNNQRIWRYTGAPTDMPGQDGKYRWMLFDLDNAFVGDADGDNLLSHAMDKDLLKDDGITTDNGSFYFFHRLIENDAFKEKFFNRYMDLINTYLRSSYLTENIVSICAIDQISNTIKVVVEEQKRRWPYTMGYSAWESFVGVNGNNGMRLWLRNRADRSGSYVTNKLGGYVGSGTAELNLVNLFSNGYLILNGMELKAGHPGPTNPEDWKGTYFVGHTQVIEAVPNAGKVFSKFIVQENHTGVSPGVPYDHTESVLSLQMIAGGYKVTAVYDDE